MDCSFQGPAGNLFSEAESDKIWAQAGIDIEFVLGLNINSTALLIGPVGGLGGAVGQIDHATIALRVQTTCCGTHHDDRHDAHTKSRAHPRTSP